ncbi:MAG: hypothetical protein NTY19_32325 [Planctomycetota bacterium]|nr:hypothetical protein [Planctomycetota bacterium]
MAFFSLWANSSACSLASVLRRAQPLPQVPVGRVVLLQERQPQIEIAFLQCTLRVGGLRLTDTDLSSAVAGPEIVGFLEGEQRSREILVVPGLPSFGQILFGPR